MANEQNLTPVRPGQVLNPNGRPKGSKNLSTIIRELENEDFDWSKVPDKQSEAIVALGSPWKAITYVAMQNAVKGNVQAAEWLRKSGYGDKMDLSSTDGSMTPQVIIEGVYANKPKFRPDNSTPEADEVAADSSAKSS